MGMAASQARYLALTARKTNTEWEGQQINQARTALANQSANLFNQLLGLEVPDAPDTTDFTQLQYSYSDGENASVLDNLKQLSTADENYNYVVDHWYYANIYTGVQKLLSNPEVTIQKGAIKATKLPSAIAKDVVETPPAYYEVTDASGNVVRYNNLAGEELTKELENSIKDLEEKQFITLDFGDPVTQNVKDSFGNLTNIMGYQDGLGVWHLALENNLENSYQSALANPIDGTPTIAVDDYFTTFDPQYIGNCKLTKLTNYDKDTKVELEQIVKDLPDSDFAKAVFDSNGNATGSIYSFTMNNVTYYACQSDLVNSMATYDIYDKPIEFQQKLPYYKANYIKTKVTETDHALIETDGNGRFTSVKFEDDSVKYVLNCETVTDEAAYQDAMNEYRYKVQQYEHTIAEINAKTEIIQLEDRTLELRLKQLDTEQNALQTEMEAVSKVIKKNVETTFKTFGD